MKIHTNLALNIHAYELSYMASILRKAAKNDGHYIAVDKGELEELSTFFGSVMNAIDSTLELEYAKEREAEVPRRDFSHYPAFDEEDAGAILNFLEHQNQVLQQRLTDEA